MEAALAWVLLVASGLVAARGQQPGLCSVLAEALADDCGSLSSAPCIDRLSLLQHRRLPVRAAGRRGAAASTVGQELVQRQALLEASADEVPEVPAVTERLREDAETLRQLNEGLRREVATRAASTSTTVAPRFVPTRVRWWWQLSTTDSEVTIDGSRSRMILGFLSIGGFTLACCLFTGFKAYDFVHGTEDIDGDGDIDIQDVGHKVRREFCCNLSPGALWSIFVVLLVGAAGFWLFWAQGIAQQVLRQLVLYGYLALVALGLLTILVQETWSDVLACQKTCQKLIDKLQHFFHVADKTEAAAGKQPAAAPPAVKSQAAASAAPPAAAAGGGGGGAAASSGKGAGRGRRR